MSGLGAFLGGLWIGARDRAPASPDALITPDYVRLMARYNAWQHHQLALSYIELRQRDKDAWFAPREGFWGSIFGTLNHLLWGDYVWMNRFEGKPEPTATLAESATMFDAQEPGDYWEARQAVDRRILKWAVGVQTADLSGLHSWYSKAEEREVTVPLATCVVHFFNHQTHHRGQVHTMLTQAGAKAPVSDLVFMPETGEWLD